MMRRPKKREVRGLLECQRELNPTEVIILTRDVSGTKTYDSVEITFIPLMDWLAGKRTANRDNG